MPPKKISLIMFNLCGLWLGSEARPSGLVTVQNPPLRPDASCSSAEDLKNKIITRLFYEMTFYDPEGKALTLKTWTAQHQKPVLVLRWGPETSKIAKDLQAALSPQVTLLFLNTKEPPHWPDFYQMSTKIPVFTSYTFDHLYHQLFPDPSVAPGFLFTPQGQFLACSSALKAWQGQAGQALLKKSLALVQKSPRCAAPPPSRPQDPNVFHPLDRNLWFFPSTPESATALFQDMTFYDEQGKPHTLKERAQDKPLMIFFGFEPSLSKPSKLLWIEKLWAQKKEDFDILPLRMPQFQEGSLHRPTLWKTSEIPLFFSPHLQDFLKPLQLNFSKEGMLLFSPQGKLLMVDFEVRDWTLSPANAFLTQCLSVFQYSSASQGASRRIENLPAQPVFEGFRGDDWGKRDLSSSPCREHIYFYKSLYRTHNKTFQEMEFYTPQGQALTLKEWVKQHRRPVLLFDWEPFTGLIYPGRRATRTYPQTIQELSLVEKAYHAFKGKVDVFLVPTSPPHPKDVAHLSVPILYSPTFTSALNPPKSKCGPRSWTIFFSPEAMPIFYTLGIWDWTLPYTLEILKDTLRMKGFIPFETP